MIKTIKLRTKIEIITAVFFIILLITASVASLSRTITDSSDSVETYIRNSNGKYWVATGANLQTAINDLTSGGTVYVPAGTIDLSSDLTIQNNVWLKGSGIGNTVLRQADGTTFTHGVIKCVSKNNFTISDLTIYGNRDEIAVGYSGIDVSGCTDFIIRDVYVDHPAKAGFRIYGYSERGLVTNIFASGMTGAMQALSVNDASETVFSNGIFWDVGNTQAMDFCDVIDCTIDNMIVKDSNMGMKVTSTSDYSYNCNFNNIVFKNIAAAGEGIKIEKTRKCNFNNIYLKGGNGLIVYSNCDQINLNNIYIENSADVGLALNGNYITANNVQVRYSTAYGLQINGDYISLSNAQIIDSGSYNLMENAKYAKIENCEFLNSLSFGLVCKNSDHFSISGCDFINNALDGIDCTTTPNNNYIITGCFFNGNQKAIDTGSTDNYYIITDNICEGDEIDDNNAGATKVVADNIGTVT
jgi:hypothetical protein